MLNKRSKKQWRYIMQMHAQYTGTTKQFCAEQKMPVQTFYSRRHTMGLSEPAQSKKSIMTNSPAAQSGQFVKAQVRCVRAQSCCKLSVRNYHFLRNAIQLGWPPY